MALQLKPYLSYPSTRAALAVVTATRFAIARSDQPFLHKVPRNLSKYQLNSPRNRSKLGSPGDLLRRHSQ